MMRSIFAAGAMMFVGLLGTAPQAKAGPGISIGWHQTYVSDHASCGCPIYSKRICTSFDRHHHPVFATNRQTFSCSCKDHKKHEKAVRKHYKKLDEERQDREKAARKHHEKLEEERRKREKAWRKEQEKREKHYRKYHDDHHRH